MEKEIKILESYYEPLLSGITVHIGQIIQGLRNENFKFYVLCSTNDNKISKYYKNLNVPFTIVPKAKYFSFRGMIEIIKFIYKQKIDIVHIHNLQSMFWANLPKIFFPKTKFYFTPQVIDFENKLIEKVFYLVWKIFSILTVKIVVLTDFQKIRILRKGIGNEKKLLVIPNSIPDYESTPKIKTEESFHFDSHTKYIVSVIRLEKQKDPKKIIDIAREIQKKYPDVKFLIIGEGDLKKELETLVTEYNLNHCVSLLGYRKDAITFIKNSTIILTTSLWEGLPYTLLEAMYYKKPIVASDIEGHKSVIIEKQTGYLANSVTDYVNKISLLLEDENLRNKISSNTYNHFQKNFSFDKFIEKIKSLYLDLH